MRLHKQRLKKKTGKVNDGGSTGGREGKERL